MLHACQAQAGRGPSRPREQTGTCTGSHPPRTHEETCHKYAASGGSQCPGWWAARGRGRVGGTKRESRPAAPHGATHTRDATAGHTCHLWAGLGTFQKLLPAQPTRRSHTGGSLVPSTWLPVERQPTRFFHAWNALFPLTLLTRWACCPNPTPGRVAAHVGTGSQLARGQWGFRGEALLLCQRVHFGFLINRADLGGMLFSLR